MARKIPVILFNQSNFCCRLLWCRRCIRRVNFFNWIWYKKRIKKNLHNLFNIFPSPVNGLWYSMLLFFIGIEFFADFCLFLFRNSSLFFFTTNIHRWQSICRYIKCQKQIYATNQCQLCIKLRFWFNSNFGLRIVDVQIKVRFPWKSVIKIAMCPNEAVRYEHRSGHHKYLNAFSANAS